MPTVRQFYIENKHEISKRINTDFAYEVIIDFRVLYIRQKWRKENFNEIGILEYSGFGL